MKLIGIENEEYEIGVELFENKEHKDTVHALDADYGRCPVCESTDITYGCPDPDGVIIYRTHYCETCGSKWEERYDLVKVEITHGEKVEEVLDV